ncbi:MAG: hypothetical protein R3F61_35585 [Myxococcota bacterium]
MKKIIALALVLTSTLAGATTIIGNPNAGVVLVAGSDTYVGGVLAHRCSSGSQPIEVGEVLSLWESAPIVFDEDEFCAIDVYVKWTPWSSYVAVPVDGFDTFKAESSGATVSIEIDATNQTAELN